MNTHDPFSNDQNSYWIPCTDIVLGILSIFLVVAVLMLAHLNDPKQKQKEEDTKSPGSIITQAFWTPNVDVDLWVKSPQDQPVGYSRKQGKHFDLLRDDLGGEWERVAGKHYENVYARNSPAGEYVINLHMYSARTFDAFPLPVEIDVELVKRVDKVDSKKIIHTTVNLMNQGQEITVVRFVLNDDGDLIPGTIGHESMPLREKR